MTCCPFLFGRKADSSARQDPDSDEGSFKLFLTDESGHYEDGLAIVYSVWLISRDMFVFSN